MRLRGQPHNSKRTRRERFRIHRVLCALNDACLPKNIGMKLWSILNTTNGRLPNTFKTHEESQVKNLWQSLHGFSQVVPKGRISAWLYAYSMYFLIKRKMAQILTLSSPKVEARQNFALTTHARGGSIPTWRVHITLNGVWTCLGIQGKSLWFNTFNLTQALLTPKVYKATKWTCCAIDKYCAIHLADILPSSGKVYREVTKILPLK